MEIKDIVLSFYCEVYRENMIATDRLVGFKNLYFNNPIMCPNFLISDHATIDDILLHKQKLGRGEYWLNHFITSQEIAEEYFSQRARLQYVVEGRREIDFVKTDINYEIWSDRSRSDYVEFQKQVAKSSSALDIQTQNLINAVITNSCGKIEYLVGRKSGKILAGLIIIHSSSSSLIINAFIDSKIRGQGYFKGLHQRVLTHCFENGSSHIFYWTFNEMLKNKGAICEDLRILDLVF